ncbi:type I-E CRISPR-associated protein Cas7/Cse4/CasC [Nocardiopsis suaedae]|uniref:Type I-E CRISPR-associated protein Cas7/Cse4/CasC n=1 Tax=Nocardiopsis suaedae TaxID=3018444 RepID=A0ABT4TR34_9ACTN|nr:type I-E CRISPR-associated protein Cas7/Cse4/CasC [Nocardiopsis suaedae]MDA2807143.1 type I-E CRISPR-associated protein Cas7/Cse4/CasC [Nocardiopsis suaedae]
MNRTIVDLHALQTLPPSNPNRDDVGAPKTGIYGGALRARVSSQAWKRAIRHSLAQILEPGELGVRTKQAAALLAARITAMNSSLTHAQAARAAREAIKAATGSKVEVSRRRSDDAAGEEDTVPESAALLFFSTQQLDGLARLAADGVNTPGGIAKYFQDKHIKERTRELAQTGASVDIALFGRMVAETADLNVEAATQVAHAISVHPVEIESDFYTAVDDQTTPAEPSAAMIGTVEFNSATFYRYAALDVDQLARNLSAGAPTADLSATLLCRAVDAFVHSFVTSLPTGKITAFGHNTLPDAVIITLRTARAVSFAGAFERPVHATGDGHLHAACQALADYIPALERAYGVNDMLHTWVLRVDRNTEPLAGLGTELPLAQLTQEVGAAATERLVEHR